MHNQPVKPIDLYMLMGDFWRTAKRIIWLFPLLVILGAAAMGIRAKISYRPQYEAKASFTVTVTNPLQSEMRSYNTATAEQMAKTFPYILTSGALSELVMQDLGIQAMPSINASVLPNTNIFSLTVRSADPQTAYDVLHSVIENYPDIAEFVVGPTHMSLLDDTGIPSVPYNMPNIKAAAVRGGIIGAVIWGIAALAIVMTRTGIHNEEELKELISLTCFGQVPFVRSRQYKKSNPLLVEQENFEFSESIKRICLRVEKEIAQHGYKALLISSAMPSEGKTTISANMALSFARKGMRTVLIDCDLRNPSVGNAFGISEVKGLSEYLRGEADRKKLVREIESNLSVIVGGQSVKNAGELLADRRCADLFASLRKEFDLIILDTPPCGMLADAAEAASQADCALMVIRQNYAPRQRVLEGMQILTEGEIPIIGCVLSHTQQSYYGYYNYGYHSHYYRA